MRYGSSACYDAVLAVGRPLRPSGALRSWRRAVFYEVSTAGVEETFGDVNVALHRADLQKTLLAALDEGAVRLGAEFAAFEQAGGGGVARFANRREESAATFWLGPTGSTRWAGRSFSVMGCPVTLATRPGVEWRS